MRCCDYETYGIHSRLKNIIRKSGGYDKYKSAKELTAKYQNIDFDVALKMCKTPGVWERIEVNGLKHEIDNAIKEIRDSEVKLASILGLLSRMRRESMRWG